MPRMSVYDEILVLFAAHGSESYFGETVSTTEHGLQAAFFAQEASAPAELVLAALLHDIGHLIDAAPNDLAEWTDDAHHEQTGGRWLARRFASEVCEPVRLHVPAKRFLCATDAHYLGKLSCASVVTLKLQGGPMGDEEVARFEAEPFHRDAIRLRHWDDSGKVAGLATPDLADYANLIKRLSK